MDNYFQKWIPIRSSKTQRISPSGVSISVKLYCEKKTEKETDFIEVDKNLLPEEWQKKPIRNRYSKSSERYKCNFVTCNLPL